MKTTKVDMDKLLEETEFYITKFKELAYPEDRHFLWKIEKSYFKKFLESVYGFDCKGTYDIEKYTKNIKSLLGITLEDIQALNFHSHFVMDTIYDFATKTRRDHRHPVDIRDIEILSVEAISALNIVKMKLVELKHV
jgi:hypothetical protein